MISFVEDGLRSDASKIGKLGSPLNMFAVARYAMGNSTPSDNRVLPSELRRSSNTVGANPEFLHRNHPPDNPDDENDC